MANDTSDGKIGCGAGRTKIIDPNDFSGFNSSSNMSVPLEDLNISVQLTTSRKARTVLLSEADKKLAESIGEINVRFIEGVKYGNTVSLTTKYTDLTTVLDKDTQNPETLGITNIEIDFNSSYAPMVTINFVDIRGSSIFQNEEQISGKNSKNKYATFFQIPYPIFQLEIKGYYGKPVTYCLHMLKFNSKFNSQTGNFEIQCEFIGYTYAMLSDLLIGYLKVIRKTDIGSDKYDLYNGSRKQEILDLLELTQRINKINAGLLKKTNTSNDSVTIKNTEAALEILSNIEDSIKAYASIQDNLRDSTLEQLSRYPYMISSTGQTSDQKAAEKIFYDSYATSVKQFSDLNLGSKLNDSRAPIKYAPVTLTMLKSTDGSYDTQLQSALNNPAILEQEKKAIVDFIKNSSYVIGENTFIDIYPFSDIYKEIDSVKYTISQNNDSARRALANQIKETIRENLGFPPVVRNIIEIYTAASEVFLETIHQVSTDAESSTERTDQLKKIFGDPKSNDLKPGTFYAWPDYKQKDEKSGAYTQKYLGSLGVLESPMAVTEIKFIEDLFQAFIEAAKEEQNAENINNLETKLWFPVNPLDSKLFSDTEPYSNPDLTNYLDIIRLCVIRGMTFLGYTNKNDTLTPNEIKAMAQAEAQDMIRGSSNDATKQALSYIAKLSGTTAYTTSTGTINNETVNVVIPSKDKKGYSYDYIYNSKSISGLKDSRILPINKGYTGDWPQNSEYEAKRKLRDNEGYLFLTNYSPNYGKSENKGFEKEDDGGIYVKIFPIADFDNTFTGTELNDPPSGVITESIFQIDKLEAEKVDASAGYNVFGGTHGMQEFLKVKIDKSRGGDANNMMPIKLLFYSSDSKKYPLGLAYNRKDSAAPVSIYDFTGSTITVNKTKPYGQIKFHGGIGMNRFFLNNQKDTCTYPYFEQPAFFTKKDNAYGPNLRTPYDDGSFSLFGSKFYYAQDFSKYPEYAKAFLFLNNLPFNKGDDASPFGKPEIIHLFNTRGGLIHAPRLWCAWVGSVLWRHTFKDSLDPIVWTENGDTNVGEDKHPNTSQYLTWLSFVNFMGPRKFASITVKDVIARLPQQAENEFIKIFFDFVVSKEPLRWPDIKSKLEIWKGSHEDFNKYVDGLVAKVKVDDIDQTKTLTQDDFKNDNLYNTKYYSIISPILTVKGNENSTENHYLFLELKDDYGSNDAVKTLIDAMLDEVVILNTGYKIWDESSDVDEDINDDILENSDIVVSKASFDTYFNTINDTIKASNVGAGEIQQVKDITNDLFGTTDQDAVKLILYKHCKNIHDKWLAGVTNGNQIINQCGANKSIVETEIANRDGKGVPKLIDSFRFVSRSFEDIGNELLINPLPINDFLKENQHVSIYDSISSLLNANKFEFIALPTYINFRDPQDLISVFKPYNMYGQKLASSACGPTFVCVYAGEKSKHLAIGDSDYPNDGFDFRCDSNGNITSEAPGDFITNNQKYEDPVGVFVVKYSQQNQNIFKDISLDQSEFTETEESLKIMDEISQKGAETNRSFAGQNLYNVYSVRSYTAQVEMMGNAMIQPMMYFQLDNIPMFHGAYMITRVKHSLKPNYMSTNFTGVRIKYSKTRLLDAYDIFMSFIDGLDFSSATGGGGGSSMNYIDRFYNDLLANLPELPAGGYINSSIFPLQSTFTTNAKHEYEDKWEKGTLLETSDKGGGYVTEYFKNVTGAPHKVSDPWSAVFISYLVRTVDKSFPSVSGHIDYVTPAMEGKNGYEVFPLNNKLQIKAEIGDIFCRKRTGPGTDNNSSHCDVLYTIDGNLAYLVGGNRSIKGGDPNEGLTVNVGTVKLSDSGIISDAKTYELLIKKTNNKYYKGKKLIGSGTIVNNDDMITGDNADYWTLIAVASLEATDAQGRCDVAQVIYNRLLSKKYGKSSIKELILDPKQFTPVNDARAEFLRVNDKKTAAAAHKKGKANNNVSISDADAIKAIELTEKAINNPSLVADSQTFIQGRTDFYSYDDKKGVPTAVSKRNPVGTLVHRFGQLFGWWVGPDAKKYGAKNPAAGTSDFSKVTNKS